MTEDEVRRLFAQQRIDSQRFHLVSIKKGSGEKLEAQIITDADAGRALAEMPGGLEFKNEKLVVEVSANSTPEGMNVASSEILTISWHTGPDVCYVAGFSDSAAAKHRALQLRAFRRFKVELNTPHPGLSTSSSGFRTDSIRISGFPPSITDKEVKAFTGSSSVIRLPSDVEQARIMRDDIECAVPNALKQFDLSSGPPGPESVVSVRGHFSSWGEAHAARTSLLKRYSDRSLQFQLRVPYPMHFTITIPLEQYTMQKAQWDVLRSSVKDRKACILNVYNVGNIVHISLSGSVKEVIGSVKVRVESLARGEALKCLTALSLDNNRSLGNTSESEGGQACPICMEDVTTPYQLGCGHILCCMPEPLHLVFCCVSSLASDLPRG